MLSYLRSQDLNTDQCLKVHDGVTLNFYPSSVSPVHVRIGITTAQDLTCDLGPPVRVHYREDNRMTIHSKSKKEDPEIDTGCQFLRCRPKTWH